MSKATKKGTKQGLARQAATNPPSPADFYELAQEQAALPAIEEKKAAKPRKGRKK